MKTLELSEKNALSAYAKGSESERAFLKNLYPEYDFNISIMDRVKTYEDACAIKGIKPKTIQDFAFLEDQAEYIFAIHQDDVINEVLNEGWNPDWSNSGQYKYYPYFYWEDNTAGGSGFSFLDYVYGRSSSDIGSRRVYKTSELATYSGKQFIEIHRVIQNPRTK